MPETNLIEKYQALKSKRDALSTKLTSSEASFKTLKSQYDDECAKVFAEYNVKSLEELEALILKEEEALNKIIDEATPVINLLSGGDLTIWALSNVSTL